MFIVTITIGFPSLLKKYFFGKPGPNQEKESQTIISNHENKLKRPLVP